MGVPERDQHGHREKHQRDKAANDARERPQQQAGRSLHRELELDADEVEPFMDELDQRREHAAQRGEEPGTGVRVRSGFAHDGGRSATGQQDADERADPRGDGDRLPGVLVDIVVRLVRGGRDAFPGLRVQHVEPVPGVRYGFGGFLPRRVSPLARVAGRGGHQRLEVPCEPDPCGAPCADPCEPPGLWPGEDSPGDPLGPLPDWPCCDGKGDCCPADGPEPELVDGCEGNGDSWPALPLEPPPPDEGCPPPDGWLLPEPCPVLGLPPDEDGEDVDGGDDEGDGVPGTCGIEGDCVDVVTEQPATTSARAAGHNRRTVARFRID